MHELGLLIAKRETIATQAELDRIAHRGAADDFDVGAVAETHFEQSTAQILIAVDENDRTAAADPKAIEAARFRRTTMIATG
ncbi:MAG TPA: hypothetical protein VKK61_01255 [Tepidisphaeraceae bacterium]|nr:hypothetical protein [Tepidisphaeraceae bacterium]